MTACFYILNSLIFYDVKKTDSLRKRYAAKLSTNLVGVIIGGVTQAIIPRGLGPEAYGDFSFLTNFFSRFVGFLDMGTSIAFYTKLSQRPNDFGLIPFYLIFSGMASCLLLIFVGCTQLTSTYSVLWPDQELFYIYLAAMWGFLTWFVQILNKIADAYGVTVSSEITKALQRVIGLIMISWLFFINRLDLTNFFLYQYFLLVILGVAFVLVLKRKGYSILRSWKLSFHQIKKYTKEFYHYSHPLFFAAVFGLVFGILGRWMLQYFSGSVEQGFYGLSFKIGSVCFMFTSAMTPLIMREFSIAFDKNDIPEMARLFRRYIPTLYAIAAYFACFVAVEASKVTYIFGGEKFQYATMAVMIMAFYPIHQTYGQLSSSVFYATGRTKLYRNIGVSFTIIGLPLTYLLIAPANMMGLNAGAVGFAISVVAMQFIAVNTQLYFNSKLLNLRFSRYIAHQILTVGFMIGVAVLAKQIVESILGLGKHVIVSFLVSGLIYSILVSLVAIVFPILFGLSQNDISKLKNIVLERLRIS